MPASAQSANLAWWCSSWRIGEMFVDVEPFDSRTAIVMESCRVCIWVVENSNGYIDSFGPRFIAEANAATAGSTKASPRLFTGIISGRIAQPTNLAALESCKRRNRSTDSPSAVTTVTVRDAARSHRGFESDGTA